MISDQRQLTAVYDFAKRSLRDQADRDYISARLVHRLGFDTQFFWSASQAIEKYLKAILVYNLVSAKGLRHNLQEALTRVRAMPGADLSLSEGALEFIAYLDEEGQNRYFEFPTHLHSDALLRLDRCVWEIRRHCQPLPEPPTSWEDTVEAWYGRCLAWRNDPRHLESKHKFRIPGGLLEEILKKPSRARDALVWKNFAFGRRRKMTIRYGARFGWSNPTHFMHEEWFQFLEPLVDFSRPVREYFTQK